MISRRRDALMRKPNVVGVGEGEREGRPIVKVLVTRKVAEKDLKANEVIPTILDGYEVDVEEIGEIKAQEATFKDTRSNGT